MWSKSTKQCGTRVKKSGIAVKYNMYCVKITYAKQQALLPKIWIGFSQFKTDN